MTFLKGFRTFPSGQTRPGDVPRGISDQPSAGKSPMKVVEAQLTDEADARSSIHDRLRFGPPWQSSISKDGIREPWQFNL